MADELKVRGTGVHDASVTREPIACLAPAPIDEERSTSNDRFSPPPRDETVPARLLSLAGGACPARESRRLRADAPNALHRDERARATELPSARREPRSTDTPLPRRDSR